MRALFLISSTQPHNIYFKSNTLTPQATSAMKFIVIFAALTSSVFTSSPTSHLSKRQGPLPDCLGDGGPSPEAKNAVKEFVKNQNFGGGSQQHCEAPCQELSNTPAVPKFETHAK
jgi:hypothetical protein